jgi:hypothetical protein
MARRTQRKLPLRKIARRNQRHGDELFDRLVCGHLAAVDKSTRANTYRAFRFCEDCVPTVRKIVRAMKQQRELPAVAPAPAPKPRKKRRRVAAAAQVVALPLAARRVSARPPVIRRGAALDRVDVAARVLPPQPAFV